MSGTTTEDYEEYLATLRDKKLTLLGITLRDRLLVKENDNTVASIKEFILLFFIFTI